MDGVVDRAEGMAYADSPTNLMWRLQNSQLQASNTSAAAALAQQQDDADEVPAFTEFSFDVTH
jgi:twitching motility protein PilU